MTVDPVKDQIVLADFWDAKYVVGDGIEPTHEWFGATSVQKLFERNLFSTPPFRPEDDPLILHLGSGDSVRALYTSHGPQSTLELNSRRSSRYT